MTAETP
jgi:hypothetical protein